MTFPALMTPEQLMIAALAIPGVGCFFILAAGKLLGPNPREAASLITGGLLFYVITLLYDVVAAGGRPDIVLLEMLPGLTVRLTLEPLGMIFAGIASFLWIITTIYAAGYMRGHHEENQTRFFFFFAVAIASALGIAFSGNMLTLFVFYEVLSLSTFPLVSHHGTEAAKRAGRVYLAILLGTSIGLLLFGMIWTWVIAGATDFVEGGLLEPDQTPPALTGLLLALYAFGIGKAALMPFHRWLPSAMVAPTPVSALLHAVAVVKAGVFSVVKVVVYIFGVDLLGEQLSGTAWLAFVAGFTIVAASIVAMRQDNLKRRLAYSTISQLSYVVIAAAIFMPYSIVGAAIHIAAHAFGKITLFFAAGAIMVTSHKTNVSQLDGIGKRMPITMTAFTIGSLSMIGLPPTAGFVSKWFIIEGAFNAGHYVALGVIIVSTLLNMAYFIPIIYAAFLKPGQPPPETKTGHHGGDDGLVHVKYDHGEASFPMALSLAVTASITVIFFFYPDLSLGLAEQLIGVTP